MNYNAYWISPDGESIPVPYKHIHTVICQPMRFGLTLETIKEEHIRFNEPLGMEGKAREQIMFELIKKGWTRCRYRFKLNQWIVQVWTLDDRTISDIQAWSSKIRQAEKKSFLNIEAQIHEISNDNITEMHI